MGINNGSELGANNAYGYRFYRLVGVGIVLLVSLCGCAREQIYPGPRLAKEEVASIVGDPKINAGLPMAAVLRKVDDVVIGWNINTVDVMPGDHEVLVDCRMQANTQRFRITVHALGGYRYQAQAQASPGNHYCESVTMVESLQ
jgi:hypothetical protein